MSPPAECGTYAAAQRHRHHHEPLDEACRQALRDYMREYRASSAEHWERDQWWKQTRYRALQRLADEYPERLAQILREERSGSEPWTAGRLPSRRA